MFHLFKDNKLKYCPKALIADININFFLTIHLALFPKIIGIAQLINKQNGDHQFTEKDEEVCSSLRCLMFVCTVKYIVFQGVALCYLIYHNEASGDTFYNLFIVYVSHGNHCVNSMSVFTKRRLTVKIRDSVCNIKS